MPKKEGHILYEFKVIHEELYRVTMPLTGEIREAKTLEDLLRSICKDRGFYLRPIK